MTDDTDTKGLIEELRAALDGMRSAEPVAWMWEVPSINDTWVTVCSTKKSNGLDHHTGVPVRNITPLYAFPPPSVSATRARSAAIEECAKVCEAGVQNATDWDSSYWDQACLSRAAAIRAL